MLRTGSRAAIIALLLTAALVGSGGSGVVALPTRVERPSGVPAAAKGPYRVVYVSDGDTFGIASRKAAGGVDVVRVLSLDTPETKKPFSPKECYGQQASARAEKLLSGQQVWLQSDPAAGARDRYNRRLAHVWLPDGRLFAKVMVHGGYGRYDWIRGRWLIHDKTVRAAQDRARAAGAGLWTKCGGDGHKPL